MLGDVQRDGLGVLQHEAVDAHRLFHRGIGEDDDDDDDELELSLLYT